MAGGVLNSPDDLFKQPERPKGLHFDKKGQFIDQKSGNYLIHNVGHQRFYQRIGEWHWWDSPKMLTKIHPETHEPLVEESVKNVVEPVTVAEEPEPENLPVKSIDGLSKMKFHELRKMYGEPVKLGTSKSKLIEMIMEKEQGE